MTNLDKFCSDAQRLVARAEKSPIDEKNFPNELLRLFASWSRDFDPVASALGSYWQDRYGRELSDSSKRKDAVEWFIALLSLLSGDFPATAHFADDDWDEIRETVSAEAETMDMDVVTAIMSILVERGKA
ncbi:MAG: hypothetical protein JW875_01370 [Spirochaetales bacterium]|nr:hypothetical protein [Spirochaetales bacterium]